MEEIEKCDCPHFLILFRDSKLQFRALYAYYPDTEEVENLLLLRHESNKLSLFAGVQNSWGWTSASDGQDDGYLLQIQQWGKKVYSDPHQTSYSHHRRLHHSQQSLARQENKAAGQRHAGSRGLVSFGLHKFYKTVFNDS